MPNAARDIDRRLIAVFQRVYDHLLDRFGTRIGTFRMSLAIVPIVVDFGRRAWATSILQAGPTVVFLMILFFIFYSFSTMVIENRLQAENKLKLINLETIAFERKYFHTRIFYLTFFGLSALFFHDLAGLGLIAIVNARCVKVRERIEPDYRLSLALGST